MDRSPQVVSRLILDRAPWDCVDDAYAARIPFDAPGESADLLQRMVAEGTATAHRILFEGRRVGLLVSRCEEGNLGRELVCIACFAEHPEGIPLAPHFNAAFEDLARAYGACSVRIHTCRPMVARLACEQHGYRITEIVLRKPVSA